MQLPNTPECCEVNWLYVILVGAVGAVLGAGVAMSGRK